MKSHRVQHTSMQHMRGSNEYNTVDRQREHGRQHMSGSNKYNAVDRQREHGRELMSGSNKYNAVDRQREHGRELMRRTSTMMEAPHRQASMFLHHINLRPCTPREMQRFDVQGFRVRTTRSQIKRWIHMRTLSPNSKGICMSRLHAHNTPTQPRSSRVLVSLGAKCALMNGTQHTTRRGVHSHLVRASVAHSAD
jgi:hypothetical protein